MEAGFDHVLFTAEKQLENILSYGTLNLETDPTFDPHKNSRTYGTVLALPRLLTDIVISGPIPPYTYMHDIVPEIKVGDRIYFHFNILAYEDSEIGRTPDNQPIYPVRYDQVYCSVRKIAMGTSNKNGNSEIAALPTHEKIIPIGGWTLVLPIEYEEKSTIHNPNSPKYYPRIGQMAHIGTPLKNHKTNVPLKRGDFVLMVKNADRLITVEGTEYYVVQQSNILGTGTQTLLKNIVKYEK